jgi:hypothetical protein
LALRGLRESLALMALMELMVLTVWTALMALRAPKGNLVLKVRLDRKAPRANRVLLAIFLRLRILSHRPITLTLLVMRQIGGRNFS